MAKSSLTVKQWKEVEDLYLSKGEGGRALAAKYGITEGAIRKKFGAQKKQIETVANQLVSAELNLKKLDVSTQVRTLERKDHLLSISMLYQSAANKGIAMADRLQTLAEKHVSFAEVASYDNSPEAVMENVKAANAIIRTANESSYLANEMLKANKEAIDDMNRPKDERPKTLNDFYS